MFIQTWQFLCSKLFSWSTLEGLVLARECSYNVSLGSEGITTPALYVRGWQLPVLPPFQAGSQGCRNTQFSSKLINTSCMVQPFQQGLGDTLATPIPRMSRPVCGQTWRLRFRILLLFPWSHTPALGHLWSES